MIRRLLSAVASILLLASTAQAAPINLLLTLDYYWPTIGAPGISYDYRVFEHPTNAWPGAQPRDTLTRGSAFVLPGLKQFELTLDVENLNDVYLDLRGLYYVHEFDKVGMYYAVPPGAEVSVAMDSTVAGSGPPWIALANLGDGISGDFRFFWGYDRGPIGTWAIAPLAPEAPEPITPVPEPASMLLLGGGLAALAAKKYRQSRADSS